MGLTSAQRHNRMMDKIFAGKAEFDRLAANDKCANYGVYVAHLAAIQEDAERAKIPGASNPGAF